MTIVIRVLSLDDEAILNNVSDDVFDEALNPAWCRAYLMNKNQHLVVAIDDGLVVGMATGLHYNHLDKPPELWINEVGVAGTHRRRGLGRQMMDMLFLEGKRSGCQEAWLLTERSNTGANHFYTSFEKVTDPEDVVMYSFKF